MSLSTYEVVLVLDDSGSMTSAASLTKSRWKELQEVARIAIEIGCALDSNGVDIIFLNRQGASNVRTWAEAEHLFKHGPSGSRSIFFFFFYFSHLTATPLAEALERAFQKLGPKPLLVLAATDGVPNSMDRFVHVLKGRDVNRIFVSILACSNVESEIGYLNKLDATVPHLDVLDDYASEKREVARRNPSFGEAYTLGDHVARYFLGSVFEKYDKLDGF
jgi:hypothetical protein